MIDLLFLLALVQVGITLDSSLTLVEEEIPPVFLGNVANLTNLVKIVSSDDFQSLQFTLISRSDHLDQMFKLHESSGNLTAIQSIDREEMCSYLRECVLKLDVAVQSMNSAFFRRFNVDVKILDINDNDPKFNDGAIELNVIENTKIGSSFSLPIATDKDGDSQDVPIPYHISSAIMPFDLIIKDNTPWLILVSEIDREAVDLYTTQLIASDSRDPTRNTSLSVSIHIKDANDNAPVFQQKSYETRIPETVNVNTTILQISASDLDLGENGRILYSLSRENSPNVKNYFHIGSVSGGLYVQERLLLVGGKTFTIKIIASDSGFPPLTSSINVTVYITDTENDAPKIDTQLLFSKDGVASVPESSPFGRVVALVSVEDDDSGFNGEITCSMEDNYFQLHKLEPKEYKVFVRRSLNRELFSRHNVVIICQDLGNPPLKSTSSFTVMVEDENDSRPVFGSETYTFSVQENGTLPSYVGKVTAADRDVGINGDITYEIDSKDTEYEFEINSTGHIFALSSLDFEKTSQVVLRVLATDKGDNPLTATTTVIVNITDVNDNFPVFEQSIYPFRILENEPVLYTLGCVMATDNDSGENGNLTYTALMHENSAALLFEVSTEGCIKLVEKLDYEQTKSYEFGIIAADNGNPVLKTTVFVAVSVIDENDNKPVIIFPGQNNDTIIIGHNTVPRSEIAVIQAYDIDSGENGKLLFSLTYQDGSDLFDIDTLTGHISTTREIDISEIHSYKLVIIVSDFGPPKLLTHTMLTVDIQELATPEPELLNRFKNLKIVSVLVCVTIVLSLAVMTIVCLIKYIDRRKREANVSQPQNTNTRHARDYNEITPAPEPNYVNTCGNKIYTMHTERYNAESSERLPVDSSTVSRQNRYNDVIMSSHDPVMTQTPRQGKRAMKIYRRNKHPSQMDTNNRKSDVLEPDLDASVLDILKRHNQVVRSVKATKSQRRELAADLFNKDPYPWNAPSHNTLGSDSGIGGSDVEMTVHSVYTIPV